VVDADRLARREMLLRGRCHRRQGQSGVPAHCRRPLAGGRLIL